MEIDITDFVLNAETHELSASVAEMGANAGKITWANACEEGKDCPFINADNRDEFERWVRGFGAWDDKHIANWSLVECNALLIQFIAGDLNELESLCYSDEDEFQIDGVYAEELAHAGTIGGRIFRGDDNRVYFYLGD